MNNLRLLTSAVTDDIFIAKLDKDNNVIDSSPIQTMEMISAMLVFLRNNKNRITVTHKGTHRVKCVFILEEYPTINLKLSDGTIIEEGDEYWLLDDGEVIETVLDENSDFSRLGFSTKEEAVAFNTSINKMLLGETEDE